MTCSYTINTTEKKMTICKNNGWSSHQNRRKTFFFASKEVGLALDIWRSRKALKRLLQNIYLMLEILYHKHNPLITTAVYKSTFLRKIKTITWEKNVRRYYFCSGVTMIKLQSTLTHFSPVSHFYTPEKVRKPKVFWHFQVV